MDQTPLQISDIIYATLKGEADDEQKLILEQWLESSPANRELFDKVRSTEFISRGYDEYLSIDLEKNLNRFQQRARSRKLHRRLLRGCAAAVVLVAGSFLLWRGDIFSGGGTIADIGLPENSVVIELSDGSVVLVGDSESKEATDNGTVVSIRNGEIVYSEGGDANDGTVTNKIIVPRGAKQHRVVLGDGSVVWINSDSQLSYPVSFSGPERRISLSGEAYFEVAKDESRPFVVESGGMTTTVQGTEFNVSAYAGDAAASTTLVSGIVKVSAAGNEKTLVPGQQAALSGADGSLSVKTVDADGITSWRDGIISIEKMPMRHVLDKLSRRYDVRFFISDSGAGDVMLGGNIPGEEGLEVVLSVLEKVGNVKFEMKKDRQITVKMRK